MTDSSPSQTTARRLLDVADRFAAEWREGMAELARRAASLPPARPSSSHWPEWPGVARPLPDIPEGDGEAHADER